MIRQATLEDISAIESLFREHYTERIVSHKTSQTESIMKDPDFCNGALVYVEDRDIVGFGAIYESTYLNPTRIPPNVQFPFRYPRIEVGRLAVSKHSQSKGIATSLTKRLFEEAQNIDSPVIYCTATGTHNKSQKAVYRQGCKAANIFFEMCDDDLPEDGKESLFHCVSYFKQNRHVPEQNVRNGLKIDPTNREFLENIVEICGLDDVKITEVQPSDLSDEQIKDLKEFNVRPNSSSRFVIAGLGGTSNASRIAHYSKMGFIPTGLFPYYFLRDDNGTTRYIHGILLQKFGDVNNIGLERLYINEDDPGLRWIRDYAVKRILG